MNEIDHRRCQLVQTLLQTFHLTSFRPRQLRIIENILDGHDVLALLPTGSGKSLCFQLPAVINGGITIVISPLLALITDQTDYLNSLGVKAVYYNSQTTTEDKEWLFRQLETPQPDFRLLYTTPESLTSHTGLQDRLVKLFRSGVLKRIVIDEAHCVSSWGHDFRPDYLKLGLLKTLFPLIQIVAFTATATPAVEKDIIKQLKLRKVHLHHQSFIRHNLSYQVRPKTKTIVVEMANLIQGKYRGQSGIIYCLSRADCESVSQQLSDRGLRVDYFHAGLPTKRKREVQNQWVNNDLQVIVATIAFGLGINKPDVRFVFHHAMPKSLEGYYQETGRAGRDGKFSDCILFYSGRDQSILRWMVQNQRSEDAPDNNLDLITKMVGFNKNFVDCRKQQLSIYLGEYLNFACHQQSQTHVPAQDNWCDNCRDRGAVVTTDLSDYVGGVMELLQSRTQFQEAELFQGLTEILPLTETDLFRLIDQMCCDQHLKLVTNLDHNQIEEYYQVIQPVNLTNLKLDMKAEKPITTYFKTSSRRQTLPNTMAFSAITTNAQLPSLLSRLKTFRQNLSQQHKVSETAIFSDQTLDALVHKRPQTQLDLFDIPELDVDKLMRYGEALLTILKH